MEERRGQEGTEGTGGDRVNDGHRPGEGTQAVLVLLHTPEEGTQAVLVLLHTPGEGTQAVLVILHSMEREGGLNVLKQHFPSH